MDQSEDPQGAHQVENVEDDDKRVHLVLLHVVICEVHKFDVLLFHGVSVVIVQDGCKVVVVCQLRVPELQEESNNDQGVRADWATWWVPINLLVVLSLFLETLLELFGVKALFGIPQSMKFLVNLELQETNSREIAKAEEQLNAINCKGNWTGLFKLVQTIWNDLEWSWQDNTSHTEL